MLGFKQAQLLERAQMLDLCASDAPVVVDTDDRSFTVFQQMLRLGVRVLRHPLLLDVDPVVDSPCGAVVNGINEWLGLVRRVLAMPWNEKSRKARIGAVESSVGDARRTPTSVC